MEKWVTTGSTTSSSESAPPNTLKHTFFPKLRGNLAVDPPFWDEKRHSDQKLWSKGYEQPMTTNTTVSHPQTRASVPAALTRQAGVLRFVL